MLVGLYDILQTTNKVADELLIARHTAWSRMKKENIPLKDKGWRDRSRCRNAVNDLGAEKIKKMTAKEVANTIKFSIVYTRLILDKNKFEYIKFWKKRNKRRKKELS